MAAGEYELALDAYYRAGSERGLTMDVLSAIGSANLKLGRLFQAETVLRRAVEEDNAFAPAFNNLGVVLMELNEPGEAKIFFKTAFAIDGGISPEIRKNLNRAIALTENPAYDAPNNNGYELVRRGKGRYLLLSTPSTEEQ
jgi:Flp pilus assembly protein TadD